MIGKVLFTLGVILLVALIWRTRQSPGPQAGNGPRLINPPAARRAPWRGLAVVTVFLMILASGLLLYDYWLDRSEVLVIQVVDATTGRSIEYRARRGDIDDRTFLTTDGRRVVLAETERLETTTISSPRLPVQN